MYGSNDQHEINYWPCVSDMFLVLFILALAMLSVYQLNNKKEKDSMAHKQNNTNAITFDTVVAESNRFFKNKSKIDKTEHLDYSRELEEEAFRDKFSLDKPVLSKRLANARARLHDELNPSLELTQVQNEDDYGEQVRVLAKVLEVEPVYITSDRHDLIFQKINDRMCELYFSEIGSSERVDPETLRMEFEKLKLENDSLKKEAQKANEYLEKIDTLSKQGFVDQEEIARLEQKSQEQDKRIAELNKHTRLVDAVLDESIIYFDTSKAVLRFSNKDSYIRDLIKGKIAAKLLDPQFFDSHFVIEIIGHTDDRGEIETNAKLGLDRARALKDDIEKQLISEGLVAELGRVSFKCFSAGSTQQLIQEDGESKNDWRKRCRRVEVLMRKDD